MNKDGAELLIRFAYAALTCIIRGPLCIKTLFVNYHINEKSNFFFARSGRQYYHEITICVT